MAAMRGLSCCWWGGLIASILLVPLAACSTEPDAPPAEQARSAQPASDRTQPGSPSAAVAPQQAPAQAVPQSSGANHIGRAVKRGYPGPLPPLPNVPYAPARPIEVTQAVYAFAARNPEVLSYVPCFCGCEHHGHQGNDDCFVASREADGKPRWEMHGYV
jgi:hypothetical protein